jgi:hypothetical protein
MVRVRLDVWASSVVRLLVAVVVVVFMKMPWW